MARIIGYIAFGIIIFIIAIALVHYISLNNKVQNAYTDATKEVATKSCSYIHEISKDSCCIQVTEKYSGKYKDDEISAINVLEEMKTKILDNNIITFLITLVFSLLVTNVFLNQETVNSLKKENIQLKKDIEEKLTELNIMKTNMIDYVESNRSDLILVFQSIYLLALQTKIELNKSINLDSNGSINELIRIMDTMLKDVNNNLDKGFYQKISLENQHAIMANIAKIRSLIPLKIMKDNKGNNLSEANIVSTFISNLIATSDRIKSIKLINDL